MRQRELLGIVGHKDIVREKNSNGVINIDNEALDKYKKERDFKLKLANLIKEHDEVKKDIQDIKTMLEKLLGQK
jgi:hypothetical protein